VGRTIDTVVLGYGLAGRIFHAPFVSAVPGLRLAGILQRTGDEAAREWPGTCIYRSMKDVLSDATVRLIVVATPNATHFSLARQALESGKHVVVDKPFAATSAEARELVDLAAAKGLVLVPFHNRRWDGDFLTVQKLLEEGSLGRVVSCSLVWDRFRPLPRAGSWKEAAGEANGLLMDLGPHLVDQALALFGAPQRLTASVRKERESTEIEDAFDLTLHYARLTVYCRSSMVAADPSPRFLLHGTEGSFRKDGVDPQEPMLVGGAKVPLLGSGDDWMREPESAWGTLTRASGPAPLIRAALPTERGDYRRFYAGVRDAIWDGAASSLPRAEDGYRVIRILEMARQSSRQGMTIPFPEEA
jgi:predicted dehydrogenase